MAALIISIFAFFFSIESTVHASLDSAQTANQVKAAILLYQSGKYAETIEALQNIQGDMNIKRSITYWQAQCYFKLKKYNQAIQKFNSSLKYGEAAEDIYYSLAQSHYANQELKKAYANFKKSYKKKYKPAASLYYMGYIQQTLNKNQKANQAYKMILKRENDEEKVKQAALFQMAEMRYELAQRIPSKQRKVRVLEHVVLPYYEKAMNFESDTTTYSEAKNKVTEIQNILAAGKKPKALKFRAIMEFGYDSNVITKADQSVTSISHKDSILAKPSFYANYSKRFWERWEFNAGLRNVFKFHQRQKVPDVYKNDNITIEPSLGLERDHKLFAKKASTFFNSEFTYVLQDYQKMHRRPFYSRAYNFELGEKADFFSFGQTTLKSNLKFYENQAPAQNSLQPGVDLNQKTKIGNSRLSTTFAIDWLYGRLKTDDTVTYKLNNRLPIDLTDSLNLTPKFNFSLLDSRHSFATRGYETKYNPGITLRKVFRNKWIGKLSYEFTRNISRDKINQQYKRHEAAISMEVKF